jgi:YfiR/HmsC-like
VEILNPLNRRLFGGKGWLPKSFLPHFPGIGLAGLILFVCALLSGAPLAAQSPALTEYEIKAGFLFNFTKFVEWPSGSFVNAGAPIILGIVGESPFGNLLIEAVAGKSVNGRLVQVRQMGENQNLQSCQILFVAPKDKRHAAKILEKLKGASVLTVGEGSSFSQSGGMIAFLVEGNKVRLEIDLQSVADAHLKISAKVIAVARIVAHNAPGKN